VFSAFVFFLASGCKSYEVISNGFILQGDDNFVSVDEELSITIDSSFLSRSIWEQYSPPFEASTPTLQQTRLLKKLGYNKRNYSIVFRNSRKTLFQIISLVNSFPLGSDKSTGFIDIRKLERKDINEAKWYYETVVIGGHHVYHAIIPVSEELFSEKYLSIVYMAPFQQNDFDLIEEMIQFNAERYRTAGQKYFPKKTVYKCNEGKGLNYFDYEVPEVVKKFNMHSLIKVFSDKEKTDLAYYSLLGPGEHRGSFRLCEGHYWIEYTTLDGTVLWSKEADINLMKKDN
jgi:hypothetical protein